MEDIESFTVVLSVAGTDPNVVLGAENTAQITIIDDDGKKKLTLYTLSQTKLQHIRLMLL